MTLSLKEMTELSFPFTFFMVSFCHCCHNIEVVNVIQSTFDKKTVTPVSGTVKWPWKLFLITNTSVSIQGPMPVESTVRVTAHC